MTTEERAALRDTYDCRHHTEQFIEASFEPEWTFENATYIAAACNAVPSLLADVERLEGERAHDAKTMNGMGGTIDQYRASNEALRAEVSRLRELCGEAARALVGMKAVMIGTGGLYLSSGDVLRVADRLLALKGVK